jgi:photosystem II stability/assembly factor-like uncharacterized protein
MRLATTALSALLSVVTLLARGGPPARGEPRREGAAGLPAEKARAGTGEPDELDDPRAAQRDFLRRRLPAGERELPVERYFEARRLMGQMPLHRMIAAPGDPGDPGKRRASSAATLSGWTALGPGNVGGRTRALIVDPVRPRTMYAAGASGGVWKTTDGGASWRPLADLIANLAVSSLAMDPGNRRVLYAGTGEGFFNVDAVRGAGIWKTADGGNSWQQLAATATPDFYFVNKLAVSAHGGERVYAATRSGVWRSLDGGATWSRTLATEVQGGCLDLAIRGDLPNDLVLASCGTFQQATVYRNVRAQRGSRWEAVLQEPGMGRTSLAIAPSNPDVVYALAASNVAGPNGFGNYAQGLHAVFRSASGGAAGSWSAQVRNSSPDKLSTALLSSTRFAFQHDCGLPAPNLWRGRGWYDNVIAVDPLDADRVWAGGVDLFRSDDGGRSWGIASYWWAGEQGATGGFAHADQHALAFHPRYDGAANQVLLVGGDGGVYRTANARAAVATGPAAPCDTTASAVGWSNLDHGYAVTQFYHGTPFPDGRSYVGGAQDVGVVLGSDAAGADGWRMVLGRDGGFTAVDPGSPNVVYAEATLGPSLVKSTDGGATFVPAVAGLGDSSPFITPFLLDPASPRRLWYGATAMWRSDDGAASWTKASPQLTANALDGITAIAVSPADGNLVAAGTAGGSVFVTHAGLSAGAGTSWSGVQPREGFLSSLAFDPRQPSTLYATYSTFGGSHVWRSMDAGASWQPVGAAADGSGGGSLPDLPVSSLVVDPRHAERLYAGTDLGVFVSLDGGASWAVEDAGFTHAVVAWLALGKDPGGAPALYAFTHGRGAWRVTLPD